MITGLHIENFKSLADFDLPPSGLSLGKFTCLIGLNGSGKSTLLQAFDFISHLVSGNIAEWISQRDWEPSELRTRIGGSKLWIITIRVTISDVENSKLVWEGQFNSSPSKLYCTKESIKKNGEMLLDLNDSKISIADENGVMPPKTEINFVYQGSVLSSVALQKAAPAIQRVKTSLQNLKSLELLSPQLMRRRARKAEDIGAGGEKLSGVLSVFKKEQREKLLQQLRKFYPQLKDFTVKNLVFGWKNLGITENYTEGLTVDAMHMNDGMLRIMAILAQAQSDHSFLLFDEIENGINPELVQELVSFLINLDKQVIVTTHSPMILNYIPDEVAKNAVILLYKGNNGRTQSVRFFDLPETNRKLQALGPGEVFVDTNLNELVSRLSKKLH